jgi:hypothetical protein
MEPTQLIQALNSPEGKVIMQEFAKIAIRVASEKPKPRRWLRTAEALKEIGQDNIEVLHAMERRGEIKKRGSRKTLQWDLTDYE